MSALLVSFRLAASPFRRSPALRLTLSLSTCSSPSTCQSKCTCAISPEAVVDRSRSRSFVSRRSRFSRCRKASDSRCTAGIALALALRDSTLRGPVTRTRLLRGLNGPRSAWALPLSALPAQQAGPVMRVKVQRVALHARFADLLSCDGLSQLNPFVKALCTAPVVLAVRSSC